MAFYKVGDNLYVQKANRKSLAEIVPTFIFGRILPKTLFTAKKSGTGLECYEFPRANCLK
jgi:hypothetical protein